VTLHVGLGTFQPIQTEDIADHPMHREWAELPAAAATAIQECRSRGQRVVAVGPTSVRVLETVAAGRSGGESEADRAGAPQGRPDRAVLAVLHVGRVGSRADLLLQRRVLARHPPGQAPVGARSPGRGRLGRDLARHRPPDPVGARDRGGHLGRRARTQRRGSFQSRRAPLGRRPVRTVPGRDRRPLWRATVHVDTLHPQIRGLGLRWWRGRRIVEEYRILHGSPTTEDYRRSPIRATVEDGVTYRCRLDREGTRELCGVKALDVRDRVLECCDLPCAHRPAAVRALGRSMPIVS